MVLPQEITFSLLIKKHGFASARELFEEITSSLLSAEDPAGEYKRVGTNPVDKGRNITPGRITRDLRVWQCMFFPDRLMKAQKDQIRSSFSEVLENAGAEGIKIAEWTLCLPIDLDTDETSWFDRWAGSQETNHGLKISRVFLSDYKRMSEDHPTIIDMYFSDNPPRRLPEILADGLADGFADARVSNENSFFMNRVRQSTIDPRFYKDIVRNFYCAEQFDIERRQYQEDGINGYLEDLYVCLEQLWRDQHGFAYSGRDGEDGNELYRECSNIIKHTASDYQHGTFFRDLQWQQLVGYLFMLTEKDIVYWTKLKLPT